MPAVTELRKLHKESEMGTNEDDKEKYDLYTEQVVLHPAKKYKWLIRIGKLLLFAVSVVIAATLFMGFLRTVFRTCIKCFFAYLELLRN